jgi:hypothetical protein
MSSDFTRMTAAELRARLLEIEAERALARSSGVAGIEPYVANLDTKLEVTRRRYVTAAVIEIATLRTELSAARSDESN